MTALTQKTAIVMVASGLSRRFGRHDKLMADLGGLPLVEHAAGAVSRIDALTRIAVCPFNRPAIGEQLSDRFVVAVNKRPKEGLGHSIALGAQIAMQFKPDAIMVCMGDMPFIETWLLASMIARLSQTEADIIHAGEQGRPHPPSLFARSCFSPLAELSGDEGAKPLMQAAGLRIECLSAPEPLLLDVDTREDLNLARRQLAVRTQCYQKFQAAQTAEPHLTTTPTAPAPVTNRLSLHARAP